MLACSKEVILPDAHAPAPVFGQALSPSGIAYARYLGKVQAQTHNDSLVSIRFTPAGSDTVSRVFVFQTDGALSNRFTTSFPRAEIIWTSHAMLIKKAGAGQKAYQFVIHDDHSQENSLRLSRELAVPIQGTFTGVGLANMSGRWLGIDAVPNAVQSIPTLSRYLLKHNTLPAAKLLLAQTANRGEIPLECASGGEGSSSCSSSSNAGSCSVTCKPFYYACCNGASCSCVHD